MVEIPEKLAKQAGLDEGQAVKWVADAHHSLAIVKKTVTDGLLEIENKIAQKTERNRRMDEEKRRAELGDLDAQRFLGMTSENKMEAAKWLRCAAEQGDRDSMYFLGLLFLADDGPEKRIEERYFWLFLSASTYSLKSTKLERARIKEEYRALQRIAQSLTEPERERIEDLCSKWL